MHAHNSLVLIDGSTMPVQNGVYFWYNHHIPTTSRSCKRARRLWGYPLMRRVCRQNTIISCQVGHAKYRYVAANTGYIDKAQRGPQRVVPISSKQCTAPVNQTASDVRVRKAGHTGNRWSQHRPRCPASLTLVHTAALPLRLHPSSQTTCKLQYTTRPFRWVLLPMATNCRALQHALPHCDGSCNQNTARVLKAVCSARQQYWEPASHGILVSPYQLPRVRYGEVA